MGTEGQFGETEGQFGETEGTVETDGVDGAAEHREGTQCHDTVRESRWQIVMCILPQF